jgi:hypothetical protein
LPLSDTAILADAIATAIGSNDVAIAGFLAKTSNLGNSPKMLQLVSKPAQSISYTRARRLLEENGQTILR